MKLLASMIVKNELARYLKPCIEHLATFCDGIAIVDDGSSDGTAQWLVNEAPGTIFLLPLAAGDGFFAGHEGRKRQALLDFTFEQEPTHVLAIDADEFIADGEAVRIACTLADGAWILSMEEVWELDEEFICVRTDGGWRPRPAPILYRVPSERDATWMIVDRALACGREPYAVRQMSGRARSAGTEILHFGWANEGEREARYQRYVAADSGRFHSRQHLDSIMWDCDRVELAERDWPTALLPYREAIAKRVAGGIG